MATSDNEATVDLKGGPAHELHHLGDRWWVFLALGTGMFVVGLAALGSSIAVTKVVAVLLGLFMLAAGIAQVITSFWTGKWSGFFLQLTIGILYTVGGIFIIDSPLEGAAVLTLMIATILLVNGILRIIVAMSEQFAGWGWSLISGSVSILLALMIYKGWPSTGLFIIGLFIGIELMVTGLTWVMFSFGLKAAKDTITE